MSTKTLRKRIALVAVSALTAGLVSVVAVPSANAAVDKDSFDVAGAIYSANGGLAGLCLNDTVNDVAAVNYAATSNITLDSTPAGASVDTVVSGTPVTVAVSGPAVITGPLSATASTTSTVALASDGSNVVFTYAAGGANLQDVTIKPTGVGTITVTLSSTTSNVKTVHNTFTIYSQTKCDTGVYSADKSSIAIRAASTELNLSSGTKDLTDEVDANVRKYSEAAYIRLFLKDKYGSDITTTDSYLTASATNGATATWTVANALTTKLTSDVLTSGIGNAVLAVSNGGVTAPLTTTVTISLNGAVIGTKTIKFTGQPAKINVTTVPTSVLSGSTGTIKYTVTDAAGNQLNGWTPVAGDTALNTNLSVTSFAASSSTATVSGTITAGSLAGASKTTLRVQLDDGTYVVSAPINTIASGALYTYSIATEKASYLPGEIVTLTITGKDKDGYAVADATALGSITTISAPGLKAVDGTLDSGLASALQALTAEKGAWTYKFYAPTTVGNYGITFKAAAASVAVDTALTKTFAVTDSSTSMAAVLKAIVSLIASINKQIALLQKALKK